MQDVFAFFFYFIFFYIPYYLTVSNIGVRCVK